MTDTDQTVIGKKYVGITFILIASVLWGTTGVSAQFAPEVNAFAIGSGAMGIGGLLQAAIAWPYIKTHRQQLYQQRNWILLGALAVMLYPLAFYGSMRVANITIGTVISIGSAPFFSAMLEKIMDSFDVTMQWIIGAFLGVLGIVLLCLSTQHTTYSPISFSRISFGILLGLFAGFTYAFYSWAARHLMHHAIPSKAAMGSVFGVGGLFLLPVLLVTGGSYLHSWNNASVGIYMAIVPMFIGYNCFGYGLSFVPTSTATLITLIEPVVATILAVVIVGEKFSDLGWLGIGLIFSCLICIIIPVNRKKQEKVPL